jgi:hypothetical protein
MEIDVGDIIGEESVWYNSDVSLYSARVSSISLSTICIHKQDFINALGKIIPAHKPILN